MHAHSGERKTRTDNSKYDMYCSHPPHATTAANIVFFLFYLYFILLYLLNKEKLIEIHIKLKVTPNSFLITTQKLADNKKISLDKTNK